MDRCRPEPLPRAHAGRDARGRGDGRASDRVAGREPLPVLPRSGRHPGTSRDLAQPVRRRAQASRAVGGAGPERATSRRMERLHLHQDLLGRNTQPLCLSRARRLYQSQEPYDPGAAGRARGRANCRLQLADVAARASSRAAHQGGDAALRHAGAAQRALPQRRLDQRGDRRQPGGGDGRPHHRPVHRGHGRQLRLRRGQPGHAGALFVGAHHRLRHRPQRCAALRLSGPHRRLAGHRRQKVHRGERALAGPGLPSLALLPPTAGRTAARRRGSAPCRHVRRVRLLGRGDDVRPLPRIQGQRVGAQSPGLAADFRRRRGSVRRQRCALLRLAGGLSPQ